MRSLKVFSNFFNRDAVLRAAKNLKSHSTFGHVRISKYLSFVELETITNIRSRCQKLNNVARKLEAGKTPYFVINAKKVSKDPNGKLEPHQQSSALDPQNE